MAESTGLFLEDFEDGNASAFTSITQEGSNTFVVTANSSLHGSNLSVLTFDGTNNDCYALYTGDNLTEVSARLYFSFDASFDGNAGYLYPLTLKSGATTNYNYPRIIISAGEISFSRFYYQTDAGAAFTAISGTITKNEPHYIELYFKAATADGANDGIARLYFDGVLKSEVTDVDSDTLTINGIYAGQRGTIIPTIGSYMLIDDIKMDTAYIGPYSSPYIGVGSINFSGSATTSSAISDYIYTGVGSIELSGAAVTSYQSTGDTFSYIGVGSIELSGSATYSESNNFSYTGVGSIDLSGLATTSKSDPLIVIDHTYVDKYNTIPQSYIDTIKTKWFNHSGESHSTWIDFGFDLLEAVDARFVAVATTAGTPELASVTSHLRACRAVWGDETHATLWRYGYGEEDNYTNAAGIAQTKTFLSYANTNDFGLSYWGFGWCWDMTWRNDPTLTKDSVYKCGWAGSSVDGPEGDLPWGLDSADSVITGNSICLDSYLVQTKDYIDYCVTESLPTKVFYTTGPVDSNALDEKGYQRELKQTRIRDYVNTNGGTLFDYADILVWDNAGNHNTSTWTDAESTVHTYDQIATDNLLNLDGSDGSGNSYHIGERGALRLAKAAWVLMAYIEGWDGTPENSYTGVGSIELAGSATISETNDYIYSPSGNITFTGSAITSGGSSYSYTAVGSVELSGTSNYAETNDYTITGSGSIELSGVATTSYTTSGTFNYTGVGSIDFTGNNIGTLSKDFIYSAIGEIDLLGGSTTSIDTKNYLITGSGQLLFTGSAATSYNTPDTKTYTGTGSIDFSGSAGMPRIISGLCIISTLVKQPSIATVVKQPSIVTVGNG